MAGDDSGLAALTKAYDRNKDCMHAHTAALEFIEEVTSKCGEVQAKVLAEIINQNAQTMYLKRYGISIENSDKETFKSKVPVITYKDIKPDIQRIANGDFAPILCASPITELLLSSGTSEGEKKMIPRTTEDMERRKVFGALGMPVICQCFQGIAEGKLLYFVMKRGEIRTPGGLIARPVVNSAIQSKSSNNMPYDPFNIQTSPMESKHCTDNFQAIYTQLLCGIYQRHDLNRIGAPFASSLVTVIHILQRHYSDICKDIYSGNLSSKITDPSLRACMVESFMQQPQPELAKFINDICKEEKWEGIIKKIWPNTKYVQAILTGSMAQYIPILNHYTGGLPLLSLWYTSSECPFGINLNPMCDPYEVSYTLMPNLAYFEFLPIDSSDPSDSQDQLVDMANVEVGKEYELVITSYTGLYRYRVEDVLYTTGFHNSTPQFKFVRRRNVVLSISTDKTTESELQKAIENTSTLLQSSNATVAEYTSYCDVKSFPGHYVIYVELSINSHAKGPEPKVLEQCCLAIEASLNKVYHNLRSMHLIGSLEIRLVKDGTFEKLRDYAISRGAAFTQYKVPRCVKSLPMLDLLDSGVVSTHFSPSLHVSNS